MIREQQLNGVPQSNVDLGLPACRPVHAHVRVMAGTDGMAQHTYRTRLNDHVHSGMRQEYTLHIQLCIATWSTSS